MILSTRDVASLLFAVVDAVLEHRRDKALRSRMNETYLHWHRARRWWRSTWCRP